MVLDFPSEDPWSLVEERHAAVVACAATVFGIPPEAVVATLENRMDVFVRELCVNLKASSGALYHTDISSGKLTRILRFPAVECRSNALFAVFVVM